MCLECVDFVQDFLAAKDELYHLRSSLDRLQIDLMSTSGSEVSDV